MSNKKEPMVTLRMPQSAWDTLEETLQMDAQSSAFDPELREEIEEALGTIEQVADKKLPTLVITMEGGIIQDIHCTGKLPLHDIMVVDFDAESADQDEICNVPQPNGRKDEAVIFHPTVSDMGQARLDELLAAEESRGKIECSHEGCKELVSPDDDYYSSPCGTYCDDHMHEHAKECGVCAKEFGLGGGDDE